MPLRSIVFDFDGVIVDSEPTHYEAIREVAKRELLVDLAYDRYLRELIGFDDRDVFRHLLREAGRPADEAKVYELKAAKQVAFDALVANGVVMIKGTRALIEEAHAARLPIAIASGATRADIELVLAGLKLRDRFEIIVTADDVEQSKPHPQTYALAADRLRERHASLNLQRGDCLAIEDTAAGLESARRAGLMTLGLTTTGPAEHLRGATRVVEHLEGVTLVQLRAWFGG